MSILGLDISRFQGLPDFAAIKASGRPFVVLKATEGVGFTDPVFVANRRAAHAAGLIVGLYHFARPDTNNPAAAEAQSFLSTVGALQAGEFLVLDWERPSPSPPVTWAKTWLDTVYAATGVRPLIYMNQSACAGSNWSAVAQDYGLWLAKYDNNSTALPSVPYWGAPAMKQYSDAGAVPGVAGTCDVDVFYGTEAQLLAYGKGGSPAPAPTVLEDDMKLIQQTDRGIGVVGPGYYCSLAPAQVGAAVQTWGQPVIFANAADYDAAVAAATGGTFAGVVARIERIDEGLHGGWGYGARIEDTQTKVDALAAAQPAAAVDPVAFAAAIFGDPAKVDALGAAIAKHMQLTSN